MKEGEQKKDGYHRKNIEGAGVKVKYIKKYKAVWIIVLVLLVLKILSTLVLGYYHSKVQLLQYSDGTISAAAEKLAGYEVGEIEEEEVEKSKDEIQKEITEMEKQIKEKGLQEQKVILAEGEVFGDKDVFNILLIGSDERTKEFNENARGDTCILFSVNKKEKKIHLVSFERGTGVPVLSGRYEGQYDWLTHTFRYGGADLMMREIQECYKVDVQYFVRVNISTFMQLIDSIGGVQIELNEAEVKYINHPEGTYGEGHIKEMGVKDEVQEVFVGSNRLNGATAMVYARCRWIDDDWHRVQRQRNVIQAALRDLKTLNALELDQLLNEVLPLIQTNLTETDITNLLLIAPRLLNADIEGMTIPKSGTYGSMRGMGNRPMYAVDFETNAKILKEFLYGERKEEN